MSQELWLQKKMGSRFLLDAIETGIGLCYQIEKVVPLLSSFFLSQIDRKSGKALLMKRFWFSVKGIQKEEILSSSVSCK